MKTLERQKQEILREIHRLGYDTLRFSIFSKERPGEWETVIEYDNSQGLYVVYATMDRAS
ncbi:Imm59 family immunity protein, partial [Streptococcus equi]